MMFSIHKAALGLTVLVAGIGCQSALPGPSERLSTKPLVVDEAMQRRDWEPTTAHYQSGATVAGPTGFWWEADQSRPEWQQGLVETPLFVAQVLMLPFTLAVQPPWTQVIYHGDRA